jgi:hypothetical protein
MKLRRADITSNEENPVENFAPRSMSGGMRRET